MSSVGLSRDWLEVCSPFDGRVVERVSQVGALEAERAIAAAEQAMRAGLAAHERAAVLDRVAAGLAERSEDFARLLVAEAGKPIRAARVEVQRAAATYTAAAATARTLTGEMVPMDAAPAGVGKLGFVLRVAIGIANGNASDFGLPSGIFTASIDDALHAARCLDFGGVTVNESPTFRADHGPYGGVKGSGTTREGPSWAVREMTEERMVVVGSQRRVGA
jgi:acyl-CoA reductase-like NAD-dependent aldehyde dehydrogenase